MSADAARTAIVIVGSGQAGFQAAASLRESGFAGELVLVGEEPGLPYQRPPLSKAFLSGKADAATIRLRPTGFFDEHRITLRPGQPVASIDRASRCVRLADGEEVPFVHLILATGARNRPLPVPGAALDGVLQLRSLPEAERLGARLPAVRRAVVVGGGFIGLEFAAVAAARGIDVTVVEVGPRLMARAVSAPVSAHVQAVHEQHGIRFLLGESVGRITGATRATGIDTVSGRHVAADLVVVGIGVVPNTALAAEAGLATDNGILVDRQLLTADPAISAIGDCASFPSVHLGTTTRIESVQNAVDQARCVAARLTGRPAPYVSLPWFWSEQGSLKLQIAGLTPGHDRAVLRGDPAAGGFSVFCYRGDRLLGVESVNRPLDHILTRKLMERGRQLTPDQAGDLGFDLKAHAAVPASADRSGCRGSRAAG